MSTRRALLFSYIDRYAALAIGIVTSMVIARLLTPTELGVFSVTMVLISFTAALRDLGSGQYLVQERELTTDRMRATWTVQLLSGCFLALVVAAAAWPVARFYGEPRMLPIMGLVALNFAVNPFGSMTYAWLMRHMRFESLAIMRVSGVAMNSAVSIVLAWKGFGPISLAYGSLAGTAANAAAARMFRDPELPRWPGLRELRRVLAFGSRLSASSIVRTAAEGAPELLLGKLQSLTAAGLYSRANGLAQMFNRLMLDAAMVVAQPLFARTLREGGSLQPLFLRAQSYLCAIGWAFFLGLALLAEPTVRLLYGDQWAASVDVARVLCGAAMLALPAALCPVVLVAMGQVRLHLRLTAASAVITVAGVAVGAWFGLLGTALAILGAQAINTVLWLRHTLRQPCLGARGLAAALGHSAALAGVTAVVPCLLLLTGHAGQLPRWTPPVAAALGCAVFVLSSILMRHPLTTEWHALKQRIRRR